MGIESLEESSLSKGLPEVIPEMMPGTMPGNMLEEQAASLRRSAGMEPNHTALEKLLKKHSGTHQLVLLQDFPDPDALSSAWAYSKR